MSDDALLRLSAQIVSAHAKRNPVPVPKLTELIRSVYSALKDINMPPPAATAEPQEPAVPIKKSVFPDYIVCLEDGKKLKMLKRHLMAAYGMTPDEYRAKWKLPMSYPMIAPDYAEMRSAMAKELGLGRKITGNELPDEDVPVQKIPAGRRGKKAKPPIAN